MLWGLGQYLGYPEKQDKAGSLLHVVTDTGASFANTDHIRGFQTNEELQFHTDGADIFALLCISILIINQIYKNSDVSLINYISTTSIMILTSLLLSVLKKRYEQN